VEWEKEEVEAGAMVDQALQPQQRVLLWCVTFLLLILWQSWKAAREVSLCLGCEGTTRMVEGEAMAGPLAQARNTSDRVAALAAAAETIEA